MKKLFIYSDSPASPFWIEAFDFETCIMDEVSATFYVKGYIIASVPLSMAFKIVEL